MAESKKQNSRLSHSDVKQEQEESDTNSFYEESKLGDGHSSFLKKRFFIKGHRFFDSGDYQMAKQKNTSGRHNTSVSIRTSTGDEIPTPDSVPKRKISNSNSSKV